MCGIVGSINKPFGDEILDLLHHRGPDDRGLERLVIGEKVEICFGHTRLSIQDLSPAGHQPMYSHCGNYLIIFNGEIYNHLELRKKLIKNNSQLFKGHSDTETIVNYVAKFGIESIREFNGIFALAILDIKKAKVYLARDRFGVKPLYYYFNEDKFIFSSEIKPILKLIDKKVEMDIDSLNTYLTLRYNPSKKTIYKDIFKVYPGEILENDIKNKKLKKIFNINELEISNIKIDNEKSESYWIDALGEKLEKAVQRQMLSDVEVGSFLSGGLDSALITAIASKYTKNKIKTFCIGFEGASKEEDEIDEARRSADILGTEHYDIIVDPKEYYEKFLSKSMFMLEEPNGTAATFAQYEVSKLASKYVKVVLAGQGADEIFMGYGRYSAELKRKKYLFLIKLLKNFEFLIPQKYTKIKRALYSLGEEDNLKRFMRIYSVFNEKEKKCLLGKNYKKTINDLNYFFDFIPKEIDSTCKMSILDTYTWLSDELLMYGDKMAMATSVEMRVPFLDNEVVKLVQQIPTKYKIKDRTHKYILKQVAKKYLPDEIINRPKKGFVMPILKWFQSDLQDILINDLVKKNSFIHKFIDKKYIENLILNYKNRKELDHRKLILIIHFKELGEQIENFCSRL